jgi:hypothetical protein
MLTLMACGAAATYRVGDIADTVVPLYTPECVNRFWSEPRQSGRVRIGSQCLVPVALNAPDDPTSTDVTDFPLPKIRLHPRQLPTSCLRRPSHSHLFVQQGRSCDASTIYLCIGHETCKIIGLYTYMKVKLFRKNDYDRLRKTPNPPLHPQHQVRKIQWGIGQL